MKNVLYFYEGQKLGTDPETAIEKLKEILKSKQDKITKLENLHNLGTDQTYDLIEICRTKDEQIERLQEVADAARLYTINTSQKQLNILISKLDRL